MSALCAFRLLPNGFTNRDLRNCLAPLLGLTTEDMTSGQIPYDLRRLRIHGLIQHIPHSFRCQVTGAGVRRALLLTRLNQRLLIPDLSQLTDPGPPAPSRLRAATRAYEAPHTPDIRARELHTPARLGIGIYRQRARPYDGHRRHRLGYLPDVAKRRRGGIHHVSGTDAKILRAL